MYYVEVFVYWKDICWVSQRRPHWRRDSKSMPLDLSECQHVLIYGILNTEPSDRNRGQLPERASDIDSFDSLIARSKTYDICCVRV